MEKLLYQKVFEKISGMKSFTSLGSLASFLSEDIAHGKGLISDRTIKRGFQEYLNPEVLENYKWAYQKQSLKPYIPDVNTLNILAVYLECESFSDFCRKNRIVNQNTEEPKSKPTITVYQSGNNATTYGDVNAQGDIIFNPPSDV